MLICHICHVPSACPPQKGNRQTDGPRDRWRNRRREEVENERKICERKCFRRATEIKLKMYNRQMRGETERDREIERETERETEVSGVS